VNKCQNRELFNAETGCLTRILHALTDCEGEAVGSSSHIPTYYKEGSPGAVPRLVRPMPLPSLAE
jgi:hypothetical protein